VSEAVVEASRALRDVLAELDVERLTGADSAALVSVLATTEKVCAVVRARAAVRAATCGAHRELGFTDPADWLSRQSGSSLPAAKAALETAAALEGLPDTRAAVDRGELSLAQAAEITSAVAEAPASEAALLAHARTHGLRSLQDRARAVRLAAADPSDAHRRRHAARSVRHWQDEHGMVHLRAALPPEVGLPIVNRLDAETDPIRREARRGGSTEPREAHAADALVHLLDGVGKGRANRADLVIVADLRAWRRGHAHPGELCHLVGGGPLPVEVVRELSRDAFLKVVLHDGVALHTVAHLGRHIPAELRTALDLGPLPDLAGVSCTEAGCGRTYGLEWDHIHPNAARGPTSYDNLQPRCWPHHQQKTERDRKAGLIGSRPGGTGDAGQAARPTADAPP
jgi:hypothetical protein